MELMDNTSNLTNYVPKIIEFPEHFVMNTQLYDKQTLKPVPMKFYTDNTGTPFILLQTSIEKTNRFINNANQFQMLQINNEHNYQNVIQDKEDSSIFYIKMRKFYHTQDMPYLQKVQYDSVNKKYTVLNTINLWDHISITSSHKHKGDIKILYENSDYFLLGINAQYSDRYTNNYGYLNTLQTAIGLLHKKSFTYTSITLNLSTLFYLLEGKDDIIYFAGVGNHFVSSNSGQINIYKFNTSTKVLSTLHTELGTANNVTCYCNPVKIGNFYYILVPYLESGAYSYKIMKISLNTTDDTVNTEILDINLNSFVLDNSSSQNIGGYGYLMYTLRVIQTSSNTYLSLLIHTVPNMREYDYGYQHKHALLKFNGLSFDVVDIIPLTDWCYGSLENGDSKHQVWFMSNCVLFYSFDEIKEKMICTYRKGGAFMQIGFDSLNRFIVQHSDRSVEMLTDTNACILKADFAEETYDKDSSSQVDTIVNFYAKNFLDEYLETNVKLTLIGPVIFKENNSDELIVSTLKTGIRAVPVIITGYGSIEVIITQNT